MEKENCTLVAKEITSKLENLLSGNSEEMLFGKKPEDVVLLGNIVAGQVSTSLLEDNEFSVENSYKSAPSIGVNFHKIKTENIIKILISGKFYYRVIPTYEENLRFLLDKYSHEYKRHFNAANELINYIKEEVNNKQDFIIPNEKIMYLFKAINLEEFLNPVEIDYATPDSLKYTLELANNNINEILQTKIEGIKNESVNFKNSNTSILDLLNENEYLKLVSRKVEYSIPNWKIRIYSQITKLKDYDNVIIQLTNATTALQTTSESFDTTVYNITLSVYSNSAFKSIELNEIKHNYITPENIYGLGINCAVEHETENCNFLKTTNFPYYLQYRVCTVEKYNENITFDALLSNPVSNLRNIEKGMNEKLQEFKNELKNVLISNPIHNRSEKVNKYIERFENEIKSFEQEIYRFSYGIKLIETKSSVKLAFELMNKTFKKTASYPGWRMFQIVFIVSEITDICYTEYHDNPNFDCKNIDNVDLIYFPTGGGKTETFLGCSFFAAFFDRIRGKYSGVTSFIKYPLRLLTAQQLDRVLALVMRANLIKEEYEIKGDIFSTGFYTGSQNTPNSIDSETLEFITTNSQEDVNSKYRQIDKCPICGMKTVDVLFDKDGYKLIHSCKKCGIIPVSIVDNEIYRNPPTFLISTIDKMANIGLSPGFKTLLGKNYGECPKHGLIFNKNKKCSCPNCKETIVTSKDVKDPAPSLFIQDELHLLNESLGTFDSHYERLIYYYCDKLFEKKKKIKYIAATATISDYKSHCHNLYLKQSRCFPASVKDYNFYSYVNYADLNRIIIGAKLYSSSITDAIQKVLTYYRIIVCNMSKDINNTLNDLIINGFTGDEQELKEILNQYLISILYCNSKEDAGRVKSALENQGKIDLASNGLPEFNFGSITGDDDFRRIKDTMHDIDIIDNKMDTPNLIVATSAISHGVDLDCFNNVFFYGMPNKTAEYIQAYSRAGRKYTGIVVDVMRIVRDRDMSYLKNFDSFHRYKDMLIEPVPIQRWAKNAIFNTLPGILQSLLYHYYDCNVPSDVKEKILSNVILKEDLINKIIEIYGCDNVGSEGLAYKKIINDEVASIYNGFKTYTYDPTNDENNKISKVITNNNSISKRPMTNLRDVDVQLRLRKVA